MNPDRPELPLSPALLLTLTQKLGSPLYVYSGDKIATQFENLSKAFEGLPLKLKYALKALSNQSILTLIQELGGGADAVSIQEVHLAMIAGFKPTDIMFTPNSSPFAEIEEAVRLGVQINIDNIPYLEQFGKAFGDSCPVCLRLNPHIEAGGNIKIMTGHKLSKFGISVEQIEQVRQIVKTYGINVNGLHIHSGSDFKSADAFLAAAKILFEEAMHYPNLTFIDFGSGFKVAYQEGDHVTDIPALAKALKEVYEPFCAKLGKRPEVWFEPGKFLVSGSGVLCVRANLVKEGPACTFVGVDSGLNHLIRPMMYGSYHHIVNLSKEDSKEVKTYKVVGYICETDTFAEEIELNAVEAGDVLGILNAGAYAFSMSSNYNSRFRPAEVLVYRNQVNLIRKRESMDDLIRLQCKEEISL